MAKAKKIRSLIWRLDGPVSSSIYAYSCEKCHSPNAPFMASLSTGRLPLCEKCLELARKAQVNWNTKAPERKKIETQTRSDERLKSRLMISGGGANGTSKSNR